MDVANTHHGQLYKPISAHHFKEARIKGFTPIQPYQVAADHLDLVGHPSNFNWPSLSELNDDIAPFRWESDDKFRCYTATTSVDCHPVMATGPLPNVPQHAAPAVLAIHLLMVAIIWSSNRMFFISHSLRSNEACEWCLA